MKQHFFILFLIVGICACSPKTFDLSGVTYDKAEFKAQYKANKADWDAAFAFLSRTDLDTLRTGAYTLTPTCTAKVQETTSRNGGKWERHDRVVDVFHYIGGNCKVGTSALGDLGAVARPYNAKKDNELFESSAAPVYHEMHPGSTIFLFPGDGHIPHQALGDPEAVKVAVVKVPYVKAGAPKPVIFDTDWWTDVDDAVALRMLGKYRKMGEIDLRGVCLSALDAESVPSISSFMDHEGLSDVPLGADREATDHYGKPKYRHAILDNHGKRLYDSADQIPDCVEFYRKLLAESDRKVDIIAVGFPNALARLLESGPDKYSRLSGEKLVRKKVAHLWMMAGKYPEGKEHNFCCSKRSRATGYKICTQWPTEITFLGFEQGNTVLSGGKLPGKDILAKVLKAYGTPDGRSSWDPMTSLMAVVGDPEKAGYEVVRGTVVLNPKDGSNTFTPDPKGKHRYVVKKHPDSYYSDWIDSLL